MSDRRPASDPADLSPERIGSASFSTGFRGFDQHEVRQFLTALGRRISELEARHASLTADLEQARADAVDLSQLSEDEVNAKVGRETTRVLSAARASAAEIQAKAEENVAVLLREAQDDAARVRGEADGELDRQRTAAEQTARDIRDMAHREGITSRDEAGAEADSILARARAEAKDIRAEAEATRAGAAEMVAQLEADAAARLAAMRDELAEELAALRAAAEADAASRRAQADIDAAKRRADAEATSSLMLVESEAEAMAIRDRAERDVRQMRFEAESEAEHLGVSGRQAAADERELARQEARQLVEEARLVRERMLYDLAARRRVAKVQLEQLRAGRERLLAAYDVVRRTLDESTGELSSVLIEAKLAADAAVRRAEAEPPDSVERLEAELGAARLAGLPLVTVPDDDGTWTLEGSGVLDIPPAPDDGLSDFDGPRRSTASLAPAAVEPVSVDQPATADDALPASVEVGPGGELAASPPPPAVPVASEPEPAALVSEPSVEPAGSYSGPAPGADRPLVVVPTDPVAPYLAPSADAPLTGTLAGPVAAAPGGAYDPGAAGWRIGGKKRRRRDRDRQSPYATPYVPRAEAAEDIDSVRIIGPLPRPEPVGGVDDAGDTTQFFDWRTFEETEVPGPGPVTGEGIEPLAAAEPEPSAPEAYGPGAEPTFTDPAPWPVAPSSVAANGDGSFATEPVDGNSLEPEPDELALDEAAVDEPAAQFEASEAESAPSPAMFVVPDLTTEPEPDAAELTEPEVAAADPEPAAFLEREPESGIAAAVEPQPDDEVEPDAEGDRPAEPASSSSAEPGPDAAGVIGSAAEVVEPDPDGNGYAGPASSSSAEPGPDATGIAEAASVAEPEPARAVEAANVAEVEAPSEFDEPDARAVEQAEPWRVAAGAPEPASEAGTERTGPPEPIVVARVEPEHGPLAEPEAEELEPEPAVATVAEVSGGRPASERQRVGPVAAVSTSGTAGATPPAQRSRRAPAQRDGAPARGQSADVDALFARLRSGREDEVAKAREVLAAPSPTASGPKPPPAKPKAVSRPSPSLFAVAAPAGSAAPQDAEPKPAAVVDLRGATPRPAGTGDSAPVATGDEEDETLLERRDAIVERAEAALARRLKRALSDEQNEVLDLLRRHGGSALDLLLPDAEEQRDRYAAAARGDLRDVALAGTSFYGGGTGPDVDVDPIAAGLGRAVVEPLRQRLERSLRDGSGDFDAIADGFRAAYREWKAKRVGDAARHAAFNAFNAGVSAGSSAPAMRWLVDSGGAPCPDAEDNALAGLVPCGLAFPTGDCRPPAHADCRCLLVPGGANR